MPNYGPLPTQKERTLTMLRTAARHGDGVCTTVFLNIDHRIPRAAARVAELRKEGWSIETVRCDTHYHRNPQAMYRLVAEPGQLPLGGTP